MRHATFALCLLAACGKDSNDVSDATTGDTIADASGDVSAPLVTDGCAGTRVTPPVRHFYAIRTVDAASGTPIAGVRLETTGRVVLTSDDNGNIAFYEPGLMDQDVWFRVARDGYSYPPDAFGLVGARLAVTEGGAGTVELTRTTGNAVAPQGDEHTRLLADDAQVPAALACLAVVDSQTGRGVPLVDVTIAGRTFTTDSAGRVAIYEPDTFGHDSLALAAPGYASLEVDVSLSPASDHTIRLTRTQPAERLYRVTGGGIYRDSVMLGFETPLEQPVLDGLVTGQDSVLTTEYQGHIFWVWGDTNRPTYGLGNFAAAAATTPSDVDPDVGIDLDYIVNDDGFARPMAPAAEVPGDGLTWLSSLMVVDDGGTDRLVAAYGKYPALTDPTKTGLVRYDDARELFVEAHVYTRSEPVKLGAHPYVFPGEPEWRYTNAPMRVRGTLAAVLDPTTYEAFTPFDANHDVVRVDGRVDYQWRANVAAFDPEVDDLPDADQLSLPVDLESGTKLALQNGSTAWNAALGRFVRVQSRVGGASFLGDVLLFVADTPVGPWIHARTIATHAQTCYNPRHHPFFDDGTQLYFECTFATTFSEVERATPRYDYNQIMYRIDLGTPELALPVPIYTVDGELRGPKSMLRAATPTSSAPSTPTSARTAPPSAGAATRS